MDETEPDPVRAEREIEVRAEARYRELAAFLPDFVATIDRERRYRWVNRVAPGLTLEGVLAARFDDFISAADRDGAIAVIEQVFETGEPGELGVEAYADGVETAHYRTRVVPAASEGGEPRVLLLTSDVTKEKRAELALRASEQRVKRILEGLPEYVLELDRERRIQYVNRTRPDTSEGVVLGQRIDDLALPEMREEVARKLEHLFETGEEVSWRSASVVDAGSYVARALPLPGVEPRALVVAEDVTREQDAMLRLHASEERLERAVLAGNIGLWEIDVATGMVSGLGWFTQLVGLEGRTVSIAEWAAAMHPEDRERARRALEDHVAGRGQSYECEYRVRARETGEWLHVLDRARVVERGGVRVVAGTTVDVTAIRVAEAEHRALERQLEHAQRLESIGLLAGGIAHDFNNLLTIIAAGAEVVRKRLATGEAPDAELGEIVDASLRGAALTQQLLAFGRRSALEMDVVEVGGLVRAVAGMAARVFPRSIEIAIEIGSETKGAAVRADRQRLEQVLLNLCVNSRDAMPDGGRLTITVEAMADEVVALVRDTGVGIADADRARIFDPFFTTKAVGAGSGLGLAVAHGIVQQHGGTIAVESSSACGTLMSVRLPRHHGAPSRPPAPRERPRGGHETILVADDEPLVLRMVKRTLEHAGYRVITASDGVEAVEAFREHAADIDLVFLDVLMPRLDGWRAHQEIRKIAPSARVLLTSGYAASAIPEDAGDDRPALLPKPYAPGVLLHAIRDALDARV